MDNRQWLDQVRKTIRRHEMFRPGETVVVGVSGGPDSVALLRTLLEMRGEFPLGLVVAHLDHGVRRASAGDASFVRALCRRWGVDCYAERLSFRGSASRTFSEDELRRARYAFFKKVCRRVRVHKIVLGHTQDDQAETVLMRVLRGTGLYGLAAILPRRSWEGFEIVRPLIDIPKGEILRYLKRHRLSFRKDATNDRDLYFRNRVRRRLIPLLTKEYNGRIRESLATLAATASEDYAHLEREVDRCFEDRCKVFRSRRCFLDLRGWERLDPCLRRMMLRAAIGRVKGDLRRLELRHLDEIDGAIRRGPRPRELCLPRGILIRLRTSDLEILKR
jgi:tRNA(Ile)-lysidine synthase